jgi:exodeoxyribonuclease X
MANTYIFDTETTGKIDPVVVEAAWVKIDSFSPLVTSSSFNQRYNPGKKNEYGALAIHNILDEELLDCPPASEFQLPDDAKFIVGHNVDYDWNVINQPNIKRICTLALARRVWPELDSYNQSALIYFIEGRNARDKLINSHSALADVKNCEILLRAICNKLEITSAEELWNKSELARVPTHINFGKHKGSIISEIPKDYKEWLLKQSDVDPYLRKALEAK